MSKKTIHIIEPRLKTIQGHFINYVLLFSKVAHKNNYNIEVWVDSSIDDSCTDLLKQNGITYHPVAKKITQRIPQFLNWFLYAIAYLYILIRINKNKKPGDSIITLSGEMEYLFGTIIFLALNKTTIPLTMQFFRWDAGEKRFKFPLVYLGLRLVTETLATSFLRNSDVTIVTQTKQLASHIKKRIKFNTLKFPNIVEWKEASPPPGITYDTPVIGYLGDSRKEKGFEHVLMAFESIKYNYNAYIQFDTFNSYNQKEIDNNKALIKGIESNNNIHFISGYLDAEKYFQIFNKIDIMVLPYDPDIYWLKSSGIFVEAVGLGKIIVTHRDTLMGEAVAKLKIGVTYKNLKDLPEAINNALADFGKFKNNVDYLKNSWRKKNNVYNFFKHYESNIKSKVK